MDETTFFAYEGVHVTNARFIVDGQTFTMSNITSVKTLRKNPNRIGPLFMVGVGAVLALNGIPSALVLSLAGAIWFALQKTVYHVMLHTSGGETSALKSYQQTYVQKVVTALNAAIVHRG